MPNFRSILKQYWGYDSFRPQQEEIISSIFSGRDTLAILPTGGGKSLTFQVPAMAYEDGITLVISPLIALMQDQIKNLENRHIRARVLHSGLSHGQIFDILEQGEYGAYRLLYVSPERLASPLFLKRLQFLKINMVAVDEAHCISQWGYDFRPSYLNIGQLRDQLEDVPFLALTASATPEVIEDIKDKLRLDNPSFFTTGINRENLYYVVRQTLNREDEMIHILKSVPGTAIVYARSRKNTERIAEVLCSAGFNADFYHAGLKDELRKQKQESWTKGETPILVATNAFGMGIDKGDVRLVIHYDAPDGLEQYYQEAGRAGRDGQKAYAVLLTTENTLEKLKNRPTTTFPEKDYVRRVYQALADYYVVGIGDGEESVHVFDLEEFCVKMKLSFGDAASALSILEWAGYITITEESENPSKAQIYIPAEDIYLWRCDHPEYERLIETLLRNYSNILNDLQHINEDYLADLLDTNRQTIYNSLRFLHDIDVVCYIPRRKCKLLIYNIRRLSADNLYIPEEAYEQKIEKLQRRVEKMYEYAQRSDICRTRLLNRYFGIHDETNCGHCDVCLRNKWM